MSASGSRSRRSAASLARTLSSRVASPRGCVAAIGRIGETRSGRKSSRSKTTGPAAIAPAVASLSAVTASASSAAASGGSDSEASSSRCSSSTSRRSTSRPNSGGIRPRASGQSCEISPATIGRSRISPSSTSEPAERPTTGASATYVRDVPKRVCSKSRYADSNASSCQSKPPQRSAVHASIGSRIERKSASSPASPKPACARAKIAAAGSRRRSSIAFRASGSRRSVGACSSTKPAHERPVLVERRPVARRVLLEGERHLRAALGGEGGETERAQGLVEVWRAQAHTKGVTPAADRLLPDRSHTSRSSGCRRPAPTSGSGRRSADTAGPARR